MKIKLLLALLLVLVVGCSKPKEEEIVVKDPVIEEKLDENNPVVIMTMDSGDMIRVELYEELAPATVENFVSLVNLGFYDGLTFHRVIPGFMIQGGDPQGNGTGGPGHSIVGEFSSNGIENNLKHSRGVISMARSQQPNSAGSQFFLMHKDSPHLDGEYAGFGRVIQGIEVVDKIASVKTGQNDLPTEKQVIKSMTLE